MAERRLPKELARIRRELERQGFPTKVSKRGHLLVDGRAGSPEAGRRVAVFAGTPSDHRSGANALADARRAGFVWPAKRH